jgi:hypothetical protein
MLNYERLMQGQLVDARDTENIWCQGMILDIYRKVDEKTGRNTVTGVLVHYNRWHKIYNEIIDVPSLRLAPAFLLLRQDRDPEVQPCRGGQQCQGKCHHWPSQDRSPSGLQLHPDHGQQLGVVRLRVTAGGSRGGGWGRARVPEQPRSQQ